MGVEIIDLKQALNHELFTGIEWIIVSMGGEGALSSMAMTITELRFRK